MTFTDMISNKVIATPNANNKIINVKNHDYHFKQNMRMHPPCQNR